MKFVPPDKRTVFFIVCGLTSRRSASTASETAHLPLLFAVGHQLELEGLPTFHAFIIIWSMDKIKDLRHGRHCASAMHVHLVFVTKRRHCSFDGQAIEALRAIFSKVCTDFQAQLVELDGQRDHVHLLVNYPPKVSVSSLVNSLKRVSSYVLRRRLPRIAKCYSEECSVVAFLFRRILWRRTTPPHQALH